MLDNPFRRFADLGYTRLVPIIPPDAPISEGSTLHKRVGTHQDGRGKTPGVKGRDGNWFSFDWVPHEADDRDLERWGAMGAGVGIKTGRGLIAIDADTTDADLARIIRDTIEELIGRLPVRVGRYPKALYLCRVDGPVQYQRIEFGKRNANGIPERVEILSDGRQFVAEGIHPKTGEPYSWHRPLVPYADLPVIAAPIVPALLETLRQRLPEASALIKEGGTSVVDQKALRADTDLVRRAVEATPNTSEHYPTRESYLGMGYAIKAAVEDEQDALAIFEDWCARWTDGENDPGIIEADWNRMKPPYRRGAGWIFEQAEILAPEKFSAAEVWFQPITEDTNPFSEIYLNAKNDDSTFPLLGLTDIIDRPPPEWLIARHIPRQSLGFVYGDPGTGKTFITLDMALHIAAGAGAWQSDEIKGPEGATVLYLVGEGSYGFRNRIKAWMRKHGNSENLSKRFKAIEVPVNFMSADDIKKLLRTIRTHVGPSLALTVVDTVSRAMPGADENLQKDMTLFVRACDAIKSATGGAVLGVHHAGKSGTMRGSTVLLGAGDYVFRLERKKGAHVGTLACEKQKDGPDGWEEPYRFDPMPLEDGESSITIERADIGFGPVAELNPDTTVAVLTAMAAAWETGEPWSKAPNSKERFAARRMVADFGFSAELADETLEIWEASGFIRIEQNDAHSKRKGYRVRHIPEVEFEASVFD